MIGGPLCTVLGFVTVCIGTLFDLYNVLLVVNILMIIRNVGEQFNAHFWKMEATCLALSLILCIITLVLSEFWEGYLFSKE
jgi:hypothetical protein